MWFLSRLHLKSTQQPGYQFDLLKMLYRMVYMVYEKKENVVVTLWSTILDHFRYLWGRGLNLWNRVMRLFKLSSIEYDKFLILTHETLFLNFSFILRSCQKVKIDYFILWSIHKENWKFIMKGLPLIYEIIDFVQRPPSLSKMKILKETSTLDPWNIWF